MSAVRDYRRPRMYTCAECGRTDPTVMQCLCGRAQCPACREKGNEMGVSCCEPDEMGGDPFQ